MDQCRFRDRDRTPELRGCKLRTWSVMLMLDVVVVKDEVL